MERTEELDPVEETSEADEIEARAERIASLERDIRDASAEAEPDNADVENELSLTRPFLPGARDARRADVIDIERRDNDCWLTVDVDGDEFDYRLDHAVDPTDASNDLVRLCRWQGIDPENIADLREVPVVRYGDEWRLFVPPAQRTSRTRLQLPGNRTTTVTHPTLTDYPKQFLSTLVAALLKTPILSTSDGYKANRPFTGMMELLFGLSLTAIVFALFLPVVFGILSGGLIMLLTLASFIGMAAGDLIVGPRLRAPKSK